ncbi:MAG TPA: LysM domain-containing protein [Tepidisphaeraceae bacterium]|jgi:5'-nucleotidase
MKSIITSALVLGFAVGCASNGAKKTVDQPAAFAPAVTEITPSAAAVTPASAAQPQQPVITDNVQVASAQPMAGGKYTVKKGDTLWSIAASHYGNGNQWQKITSANPGLTAETLKAGQKINVP